MSLSGCGHGDVSQSISEEDEVKVHAVFDIEEGELSSGEEGEIKDASRSRPPEVTPTAAETRQSLQMDTERESGLEEEEEEEDEDLRSVENDRASNEGEMSGQRKIVQPKSPERSRAGAVCRHFLQGKCSWGKECRFSHDDRALPVGGRLPRPHGPRALSDRLMDPYLVPVEPDFIRLPPRGPVAVLPHSLPPPPPPPPPLPPREGVPVFVPYSEHRSGVQVSHVEEESEGWYRLRTVASHWSSGEEEEQRPSRRKRGQEKERSDSEQERNSRKRESSESSGSEVKADKRGKRARDPSPADQLRVKQKTHRDRESSGSELRPGHHKKRRQSSSSESSDVEQEHFFHHHRLFHSHPGPPFFDQFPPFGPPRFLPMPPHGPAPFAATPHAHFANHYVQPSCTDWQREPSRHHHTHREQSKSPRRSRHGKASSSSQSLQSSPEHRKHGRKKVRALDRKEQLLQELSVINKVIERKKQKKSNSK